MDCELGNNISDIRTNKLTRAELEDQLFFYKKENDKKDDIIRELAKSSHSDADRSSSCSTSSAQSSAETVEELKANLDIMRRDVLEKKNLTEEQNTVINELRAENSNLKLNAATSAKKIEQLEKSIRDASNKLRQFDGAQKKQDFVLQSLQNEIKSKNVELLDLKNQQRAKDLQILDALENEKKVSSHFTQTLEEMAKILDCESNPETCVLKLLELAQTSSNQKTLLAQKSDEREEYDFAQRASRETIQRLSGELNKEQKEKEAALKAVRSNEEELQKTRSMVGQMEQQNAMLKDRIKQLTSALQLAREDASEKDKKLAIFSDTQNKMIERLSKAEKEAIHVGDSQFLRQLGTGDGKTLDSFINNLTRWFSVSETDDPSTILSLLENRIQELLERSRQNKLEKTESTQSRFSTIRCTQDAELQMRQRIEQLEIRLSSEGMLNDDMRKQLSVLNDKVIKIAAAAKLDGQLSGLDMDAFCEALIMRVSQLQLNDTENQAKQRLQITRLQRQLKETREKADAFELHVSVLRNRLNEAQMRRSLVGTPASQTSMSLASSERERRRLAKQLQQTKEESNELRKEIVELKARLLDSSEEKLAIVGQSKAIRFNEAKFNQVTRTCDQLKAEVAKLNKQLKLNSTQHEEDTTKLRNEIAQLEKELEMTKESLETSRRSEKQLLDFRSLVACHLGLNSDQLSIPDYQIMIHLDNMIREQHSRAIKGITVDKAMGLIGANNDYGVHRQ